MSVPSTVSVGSAAAGTPVHADALLRLLDRPITAGQLEAGADLAARPAELRSQSVLRILLFRVGQETAALPVKLLRRVTPRVRTVPIPHRNQGVLRGVCNIRGEHVLCADLHRLLGMSAFRETDAVPGAVSDPRSMVVIGPADDSWAFEVDALMGVESVDPAAFRQPPFTVGHALGDFTSGVTEVGGRSVTILDGGRVLAGFKAGLS